MLPLPSIETDEQGVWLTDAPNRRWGIRWDEITRVSVGKLDMVDQVDTSVELDFEFGEYVELNSAFPGFAGALASICARLPGVVASWRAEVEALKPGQPPLILWTRDAQAGPS